MKQTGTAQAVLGLICATSSVDWTIEGIAHELSEEYSPIQIANAANYLARNGSISREGYAGHFTYSCLPSEPTPPDEVDVIERLLTVMAEAEPILRRLQAAHRAFSSISGISMPKPETD